MKRTYKREELQKGRNKRYKKKVEKGKEGVIVKRKVEISQR